MNYQETYQKIKNKPILPFLERATEVYDYIPSLLLIRYGPEKIPFEGKQENISTIDKRLREYANPLTITQDLLKLEKASAKLLTFEDYNHINPEFCKIVVNSLDWLDRNFSPLEALAA